MDVDPLVSFEPRENHGTASKLSVLICEKGSLHMMLCSSAAETHGEDLMQRIVNIEKHQFPALHPLGNH